MSEDDFGSWSGTALGRVAIPLIVVLAACLLPAGVAFAAGDATSAGCPNEASPGFRTYLPECRAYELVSPPYKGGFRVFPEAISHSGERLMASSIGAFAGTGNDRASRFAAYDLARTQSGWDVTALEPIPAEKDAEEVDSGFSGLASGELEESLFEPDYELREPDGTFSLLGPHIIEAVGASADLTHVLVRSTEPWPNNPEPASPRAALYEYEGVEAPGEINREPRLVGVGSDGMAISACGTALGGEPVTVEGVGLNAASSGYNAVSASGETVFFTALECAGSPAVSELYARIGSAKTVAISEPSKEDCEACETSLAAMRDAVFQGASEDGSKVFFTTEQELLPGQTGMNVYQYDFNGPAAGPEHPDGRISLVSAGSSDPEVQGVVRVSANGERVYFVAKAELKGEHGLPLENAETKQKPEAGADNLYVYEPDLTGGYHDVFVGVMLNSQTEAAVEQREEHGCPSRIELEEEGVPEETAREDHRGCVESLGSVKGAAWQIEDRRPAQATPDGRFLLFLSAAPMTPDDKSEGVPQLFEYDAQSQKLTRVSVGQRGSYLCPATGELQDGYSCDGNTLQVVDAPQIPVQNFAVNVSPTTATTGLAVAEDGEVFFESRDALTPGALAGSPNVYAYREGDVYLISDGRDSSSVEGSPAVHLIGADESGRDVFFTTDDSLVPEVTDTQEDVYDARVEGGFPAPVGTPGCVEDACQGPLSTPFGTPAPGGSALTAGGGNLTPAASKPPPVRPKPLTRAQKLAKALKACTKKTKKQRAMCKARARKLYGAKSNAKKSGMRRNG